MDPHRNRPADVALVLVVLLVLLAVGAGSFRSMRDNRRAWETLTAQRDEARREAASLRQQVTGMAGAIRSEQSWFLLCHERYMECRERTSPPPSRDGGAP